MFNLTREIDLSSRPVFILVWLASTFSLSYIAISISNIVFVGRMPDLSNAFHVEILQYTYSALLLSNGIVFLIFLLLLKHVNKLRARLSHKVRYDGLTGVLSRGAFLDEFHREHAAKPQDRTDAFLIVDADHFKKINDTFGHHAGDKALVAIANALRESVRETDIVGRLGGEEFVIHLKDTSVPLANEIAERIRRQVRKAADDVDVANLNLSVSAGLFGYNNRPHPDRVMAFADQLLYAAKESGRDRVEASFAV